MHNPETESFDELGATGFRVIQARDGYRFSIDPVLLAAFSSLKPAMRCLDLGTGSGVLPLLLTAKERTLSIAGLELQQAAVDRAQRTMKANGVSNVEILQGDVRTIRRHVTEQSFDCVVSNPPYRNPGQGRIPPGDERAVARFELAGDLTAFVAAAAWGLKAGGVFTLIHLAERTAEILRELHQADLEPKRLRMVHPHASEMARMVLVEARKGGRPGLEVLPPLVIYQGGKGSKRCYTEEVLQMYGMASV